MSSAALLWRREGGRRDITCAMLKSAKKDEDRTASNTYLVIVISRSATHTTNYSGAIPLFCVDGVCDQICASLLHSYASMRARGKKCYCVATRNYLHQYLRTPP